MPHHSKQSVQHRERSHLSLSGDDPNHRQSLSAHVANKSYTISRHPDVNWMPPVRSSSGEEHLDQDYRQRPYDIVPTSPQDVLVPDSRLPQIQEGSRDVNDTRQCISKDSSQAIATVLLLAAAASSEKELALSTQTDVEGNHESESFDSSTSGSRPLKKRRNRDNVDFAVSVEGKTSSDGACHVSPISHSSKSGISSDPHALSHDTPSTSSAHSFDMKEDTTTKRNTENLFLSTQRNNFTMIPHFPSRLHWLLSDLQSLRSPPLDPTVLQWVSHGQAWRIVRWDFFHRSVLPAAFPQLALEANGMSGSIDAFLWQLKAWGFEEIKDGPDVGAFAHTLFRRGHPLLCEDMKFAPIKAASSFTDSRSILRVPSLASTNGPVFHHSKPVSDQPDLLAQSISTARSIVDYTGSPLRHYSVSQRANNSVNMQFGHSNGPPAYVNYSPEEINITANGWKFSSSPKSLGPWPETGSMEATRSTDQGQQTVSPYSPLRIRSTRGARRPSLTMSSASACNSNTSLQSSPLDSSISRSRGFPVSNRGKGRRTIVANPAANRSYSDGDIVMLSEGNAASETVLDHSLSTNNDMKHPRSVLKRKLPMAANSDVAS